MSLKNYGRGRKEGTQTKVVSGLRINTTQEWKPENGRLERTKAKL